MKKLVVIDGNSILNRAFYGIMGSKMLMTKDGKYTKEESPLVDNINDIIDEYPYYSSNCVVTTQKEYDFPKEDVASIKIEDLDNEIAYK